MIKGGGKQNVRVICRIRPTNKKELENGGVVCVKHTEQNIEVKWDGSENKFNFDRIFGPESIQSEVFSFSALPLIQDVLNGYNATIFAYGQTGTGKVSESILLFIFLSLHFFPSNLFFFFLTHSPNFIL